MTKITVRVWQGRLWFRAVVSKLISKQNQISTVTASELCNSVWPNVKLSIKISYPLETFWKRSYFVEVNLKNYQQN